MAVGDIRARPGIPDDNSAAPGMDQAFADGGIDCTAGFNPKDPHGRQEMPMNAVQQPYRPGGFGGNKYEVQPSFEHGEQMFDSQDYPQDTDDRQAMPAANNDGDIPDPHGGDPGQNIDFNAVAPYVYGEFPKDGQPTPNLKMPIA